RLEAEACVVLILDPVDDPVASPLSADADGVGGHRVEPDAGDLDLAPFAFRQEVHGRVEQRGAPRASPHAGTRGLSLGCSTVRRRPVGGGTVVKVVLPLV